MTTTIIISSYTCSRTTTTTTLFSGGPTRESHLTVNESNIQQNESHCIRSCWVPAVLARGESAQRSRRIGADRRVTATAPPPPLLLPPRHWYILDLALPQKSC
uniref:Uncharacterized protein n=1 Tax=Trichogramma kaykai TaxID=54128 RepID=A0ABD2XM63_9HYME